jgi:uncharacterized membrane protein YccC
MKTFLRILGSMLICGAAMLLELTTYSYGWIWGLLILFLGFFATIGLWYMTE